jgi:hypothetical protein
VYDYQYAGSAQADVKHQVEYLMSLYDINNNVRTRTRVITKMFIMFFR